MLHKVGKAIETTYQASGAVSGLTDVTLTIYDETHVLDGVNFPSVVMTEIDATGCYHGTFTPDAEGEWTVTINSATAPGRVVKKYEVAAHDVDSVGDAVAVADGKVDTVDSKIVTVDGKVATAIAGVATVDSKVNALNDIAASDVATELETYDAVKKSELDAVQGGSETLETIKTAVDGISTVTPPMIG